MFSASASLEPNVRFRYQGLDSKLFRPLFELRDNVLSERSIRRMIADENPGFPCRVTLEDAAPGEPVLLVPFEHHRAASPYRAAGPIFVRKVARDPYDGESVPPALSSRLLSLRAYAADGMMVDADVVEGSDVEQLLERLFRCPDAAYVHAHFARRGCYACRIERA